MVNIKDKIPELLEEMKESANLLYQQRIQETKENFEQMLSNMLEIVDFFFEYHNQNLDFPLDEEHMKRIFAEVLSAMEEEDYTLMADMITYDFAEYVTDLYNEL